jgi:hypothetical protein
VRSGAFPNGEYSPYAMRPGEEEAFRRAVRTPLPGSLSESTQAPSSPAAESRVGARDEVKRPDPDPAFG